MRFIIASRSRRSITPTPAANAAASMLPNNHIVSSVSPRSQYAEIETFPVVLFSISITSRLSTSYLYLCGCINHESDSFHTRLIFYYSLQYLHEDDNEYAKFECIYNNQLLQCWIE